MRSNILKNIKKKLHLSVAETDYLDTRIPVQINIDLSVSKHSIDRIISGLSYECGDASSRVLSSERHIEECKSGKYTRNGTDIPDEDMDYERINIAINKKVAKDLNSLINKFRKFQK